MLTQTDFAGILVGVIFFQLTFLRGASNLYSTGGGRYDGISGMDAFEFLVNEPREKPSSPNHPGGGGGGGGGGGTDGTTDGDDDDDGGAGGVGIVTSYDDGILMVTIIVVLMSCCLLY